jgi:hypothetical protein
MRHALPFILSRALLSAAIAALINNQALPFVNIHALPGRARRVLATQTVTGCRKQSPAVADVVNDIINDDTSS